MTARTSAGAASTVMLDSVRSAMAGRLPVDLQQGAAQREQAEPEGRHRDDTQDGGHGATTGPGQERGGELGRGRTGGELGEHLLGQPLGLRRICLLYTSD